MTDILTRLKAATAGSRELDARIHCELVEDRDFRIDAKGRLLGKSRKPPHDECIVLSGRDARTGAPTVLRYTSDVSSALALVEAKLPGHGWVTGKRYNGPGYFAEMYDADFMHEVVARSDAPTASLALLIALFTALEPLSDGHLEAKTGDSGTNKTPSKTPLPGAGGE